MNPMDPYQGNQPYIFVSYPHKDSDTVLPIIASLQKNGFRVWFDKGIELGRPWDNSIATHIRQCSIFLVMMSPNYLVSPNCCDEIYFARECGNSILMVYTRPVTLPDYMTMRYGRNQAIRLFDYQTIDQFLDKLFSAPELASTRNIQEEPAYAGSELTTMKYDELEAQLLELMRSDSQLAEKLLRSGNIRLTHPSSPASATCRKGQHFVLRTPDGQLQLILTQAMTTIGRSAELQDLFANDHRISRQHACLQITDERLYLTNMSRANTIYVNGEHVDMHNYPLKEGDRITFTSSELYPLIVSIQ